MARAGTACVNTVGNSWEKSLKTSFFSMQIRFLFSIVELLIAAVYIIST